MPMKHPRTLKPPYAVPSMATIVSVPWNGLRVVSMFAGAGGSCLGYRMAGYQVLWANEFAPSAQRIYRANAAPETFLDCRDIREVQATDICAVTHCARGEIDVLDGSPPCQAFSMAGKRAEGWHQEQTYAHGAHQKNVTLFTEYIRLVRDLQPKVFVAENVSGLVKGVAKGYFKAILTALKACGYVVEARMLDAQWLGVPQRRQRLFFIGLRQDLGLCPVFPTPLSYRYSVREALPWIRRQAIANDVYEDASQRPAMTVVASTGRRGFSTLANEHSSYIEAPIYVEDGHSYTRNGLRDQAWINVSQRPMPTIRAQRPMSLSNVRAYRDKRGAFGHDAIITDQPAPTVLSDSIGMHWIEATKDISAAAGTHLTEKRKFTIAELKRICAFPDDFVLHGSYAEQWACLGNSVPPVMMFHVAEALCDHLSHAR
jgi:DNA (cytosine-5)-methyltransferase 1